MNKIGKAVPLSYFPLFKLVANCEISGLGPPAHNDDFDLPSLKKQARSHSSAFWVVFEVFFTLFSKTKKQKEFSP